MKSGTESKLKFKKLQRRLGLKLWECTGLLEAIWRCTLQNAPAGDLGRLTNEDIAAAIEWEGPADELIDALVCSGWLDRDDEVYRLVVHHWSEHCPNHLKGGFKQSEKEFADVELSRRLATSQAGSLATSLATSQAGSSERVATNPNLTKPILTYTPTHEENAALSRWSEWYLTQTGVPWNDIARESCLMDAARKKWGGQLVEII